MQRYEIFVRDAICEAKNCPVSPSCRHCVKDELKCP